MKRLLQTLFGPVLALAFVQGAHAGPTPTAVAEIKYLLDFVGKSGCGFYRNGVWYDSGQARIHLSYKYDVLVDHGQIKIVDDFIEKAATKSSLTGLAYRVRCSEGPEIASNQWLRAALATYRSKGVPGPAPPARGE